MISKSNPSPTKWCFPASAPNSRAVYGMVIIVLGIGLFIANRSLHQAGLNASLVAAVEQGKSKDAEDLLAQGANPNTAKPWFHTIPPSTDEWYWFRQNILDKGNAPIPVLCVAAGKHDLATVNILLAHGADVNARSCHNYTALFYAPDNAVVTEDLLRHGADRNARDIFGDTALPTGK